MNLRSGVTTALPPPMADRRAARHRGRERPARGTNTAARGWPRGPSQLASASGFTLIELLVAVGIVGILAAIAYPSYSDYVIRGKIPDALGNLAAKRVQLEQFFQDSQTFVEAPACAADTATSPYFDFSCTVQTATTYTLRAAGKNSMAGFTYTINERNAKTTAAVPTGWSIPTPNNCWVTKRGGIC